MATLINIINLVACGLSAALGTGTKGCKPFFKKVTELWLVPQGFVFDGSQTLNSTYAKQLQAEGNLIVLKGIRTFTDNSSDDQIETFEDQTEQVTSLGLYKFLIQFVNGLYFHAALSSLSSFGQYDVLMVDRDGNILGTKAANGSLKGFTAGMIQSQKLIWATDTTAQREGLAFQLTVRSELDENYVFIQKSDDFDPRQLSGINEVVLSFTSTPVDTDTSISVKAVRKQDNAAFTGVDYNQFNLKVDGATSNPTAGDDSATTGTFVLTVSAVSTGEVLAISLYDNSNNRAAIDVSGDLYKSNTATATVVSS